jgi:hypothetical protein
MTFFIFFMNSPTESFVKASRLIEQTLKLPQKSESQINSAIGIRESGGLHRDMVICGLLIYDVPMGSKRKWDKLNIAANTCYDE